MIRIETISQLRSTWSQIADALSRDLAAAADLQTRPLETLRRHGYDLSTDMLNVLILVLP